MAPVSQTSGLVCYLVLRVQFPLAVLLWEIVFMTISKYFCQWDLLGWFLKTFNIRICGVFFSFLVLNAENQKRDDKFT